MLKKVLYFLIGLLIIVNVFLLGIIIFNKGGLEPKNVAMGSDSKEETEEIKESIENIESAEESFMKEEKEEEKEVENLEAVKTLETEKIKEEFLETSAKEIEAVSEIKEVESQIKVKENNIDGELSISLVGDIMMDASVRGQVEKNGYNYLWEDVKKYFLADDISIGNLESSITRGGTIWPEKQYNFRSDPKNLEAMKNAGIDVVSLANNHSLDYGYDGLLDTLDYIDKSGILRVGAGRNSSDANKVAIINKNGYKVGILGYSRVVPSIEWYATSSRPGLVGAYDSQLQGVLKKVEEAKETVDILIISMHWGTERQTYPRDIDPLAGRKLIDAGADIIMGHHPHVLQGIEIYKGKPIFYSLGNFVFGARSELTDSTMIGQVNFKDGQISGLKVIPHKIVGGKPTSYNEEDKKEKIQYINELSKEWGVVFDLDGILKMD